jgi:hypothetical protein
MKYKASNTVYSSNQNETPHCSPQQGLHESASVDMQQGHMLLAEADCLETVVATAASDSSALITVIRQNLLLMDRHPVAQCTGRDSEAIQLLVADNR